MYIYIQSLFIGDFQNISKPYPQSALSSVWVCQFISHLRRAVGSPREVTTHLALKLRSEDFLKLIFLLDSWTAGHGDSEVQA